MLIYSFIKTFTFCRSHPPIADSFMYPITEESIPLSEKNDKTTNNATKNKNPLTAPKHAPNIRSKVFTNLDF